MPSILFIDGGGPIECELTDTAQGGISQPSHSVDLDFGDPVSGMTAICVVSYIIGIPSDSEITSFTIGGVEAEVLRHDVFDPDGDTGAGVAIIALPDSGGGTLTVSVSATGNISPFFGAFRALNIQSLTPTDTAGTALNPDGDTVSIQVDTVSDGLLIAGAMVDHEGTVELSTGVPEEYNGTLATNFYALGGHLLTSAEIGRTITVNRVDGAPSMGATALTAVSLR